MSRAHECAPPAVTFVTLAIGAALLGNSVIARAAIITTTAPKPTNDRNRTLAESFTAPPDLNVQSPHYSWISEMTRGDFAITHW